MFSFPFLVQYVLLVHPIYLKTFYLALEGCYSQPRLLFYLFQVLSSSLSFDLFALTLCYFKSSSVL